MEITFTLRFSSLQEKFFCAKNVKFAYAPVEVILCVMRTYKIAAQLSAGAPSGCVYTIDNYKITTQLSNCAVQARTSAADALYISAAIKTNPFYRIRDVSELVEAVESCCSTIISTLQLLK